MFKKLFGKGNQEDKDAYVDRVAEMQVIMNSDMDEENKKRIIMNMNNDIEEDYE